MRKGYLFVIACLLASTAYATQVTFVLNSSTYPKGATDSTSTFTVRGDFNSWSSTPEGTMTNIGGDYWSVTIAIDPGTYGFKFPHTDALGADKWEDNLSGNRSVTVTANDTTLALAYWDLDYDEAPFTPTDSIDVWFRVNMGGVIGFDTTTAAVNVRGGIPPLNWDPGISLTRETDSYFYSGLASFHNDSAGVTVEYKFNYDGSHWESDPNRTFTINQDTTLAWKWFDDQPAVAEIDTFQVTFVLNTATADNITDSTAVIFATGPWDGWDHYNDTLTTVGDYSSRTMEFVGPADATELEYTFLYHYTALPDEDNWEGIGNHTPTINSDTTFFHWWKGVEPYTLTDSIDVWFRVNMAGVAGFDTATAAVNVRGSVPPLDWGPGIPLTRETDSYYYSGLVSFANDSAGVAVMHKFNYDDSNWETTPDRPFTLSQDTTLAFKYFSDEPPTGVEAVEALVVFTVDIGAYETMGIFSVPQQDTMQVRGGFNGWSASALPDQSNLVLTRISGTTIYQSQPPIAITKFPESTDEYKYYIKFSQTSEDLFLAANPHFFADMGYENPADWGGANRVFTFIGDPATPQEIPLEYYAGVPPLGLIPEGTTVSLTFTVDMRPGILAATPLFDPVADSVWWVPKDEWVAHVLGYIRTGADEEKRPALKMAKTAENDSIYTITFDYVGYVPYTMVYVYEFGSLANGYVQEGGGYAAGRFRGRYIQPESIGPVVWPAAYTVPTDLVQQDPPLVQEEPPELEVVGIKDGHIMPKQFTVSQNYPNPFNPTTEIQFTLPRADEVTFTVYNLLGQRIATLSRDFPAPGTYAFRWHGCDQLGRSVPSGIYFYEVKTTEHRVTRKMTLLK